MVRDLLPTSRTRFIRNRLIIGVCLALTWPALPACDSSPVEQIVGSLFPSLESATPGTGPMAGGTRLTLRGRHFEDGAFVMFGDQAGDEVVVKSNSVLTVVSPMGLKEGTVDIKVIFPSGYEAMLPEGFTYGDSPAALPNPVDPMRIDTVEPAAGPISGGAIISIRGSGFVPDLAVMFDGVAGRDVLVLNSSILTVVVPPHDPGRVNISLRAGKDGPAAVSLENAYEFYVLPPDDGTDSDRDGLTDVEELTGWDVWVDAFGLGLGVDTFGNVSRVTAYADPKRADTDGDGASDLEESLYRSDPTKFDTDGDGLSDGEEVHRWQTSPISVDTDHDARGPEGNRPPNPALFDGRELFKAENLVARSNRRVVLISATSPTLEDSDGDGRTDYEEFNDPVRKPIIADLPQAEISIVDDVDINLFIEYEENQGTETEYSVTMSQTTSNTLSRSDSISNSATVSASVTAGFQAGSESHVHASATAGISFTNEGSTEWGNESTREAQQEYSRSQADSLTRSESASRGEMKLGMVIRNTGNIAFDLKNLAVVARQFTRGDDPNNPGGEYKTIGTLQPVLPNFTLAPGAATNVIEVSATEVNPNLIRQFLANPTALSFQTAGFELENAEGINFTFLTEQTYARTAMIVIDYGDGTFNRYRVATNVNRDSMGALTGVSVRDVFQTFLKIQYAMSANPSPASDGEKILSSLTRGDGAVLSSAQGLSKWVVFASPGVVLDTDTAQPGGRLDFDQIVLHNRDELRLVYIRDHDGDLLLDREEFVYGTSDDTPHSDRNPAIAGDIGDGLTDFDEINVGWTVTVFGESPRRVFSDPRTTDADADGWTDDREKLEQTNPNLADTDEDGLMDSVDPNPLAPAGRYHVNIAAQGANDGSSWADAATDLYNALVDVVSRNADGDDTNDVSEIWVAQGVYRNTRPSRVEAFFDIPNVGIYGGFTGVEKNRSQRNPDPLTNGTVLSADRGVTGDPSDNSIWVVSVGYGNEHSVIDGFTLSDGNADGGGVIGAPSSFHGGSGIYWFGLRGQQLRNLFITGNRAVSWGGGVLIEDNGSSTRDDAVLENCFIGANSADAPVSNTGGSGVCVKNRALRMVQCQINDNEITAAGGSTGGAILVLDNASITMMDCEVNQNRCNGYGAAGIMVTPLGFARITNTSVRQNTNAGYGAGGMLLFGRALLTNCDFWSNRSNSAGNATGGGGLCVGVFDIFSNERGNATLVNCTFANNHVDGTTPYFAAGVRVYAELPFPNDRRSGVCKAYNCIFYGNTAGNANLADETRQIYGSVAAGMMIADVTVRSSCIQGLGGGGLPASFAGFANIGLDPRFKSSGTGNITLESDSPCIDLGNSLIDIDPFATGLQRLPEFESSGKTRIADGNGDGIAAVDMGAFEYRQDD